MTQLFENEKELESKKVREEKGESPSKEHVSGILYGR